jgi:hypothetical protein
MKNYKLEDFKKGWFIGNFEPSVFNGDFEVGIKEYKSGDKEERHLHKLSKEYTVIVSGRVKMNNIEYKKGDIIEIVENEDTDFECLEDSITVVVKTRSIKNDKYKI